MKKHLTVHNLYETIDNGDGTMDLRFEIEDKNVWVKGVKVPDDVSEFYFDVDEIVQNAIETGWIEYQQKQPNKGKERKMAYTNIDGITVEQFNEIIREMDYYGAEIYHMDDLGELFADAWDAIRAAYYGGRYGFSQDQFNPNDYYFIFDGYANLVSIPAYYVQDYINSQFKDDILDYVNENEIELEGVEEEQSKYPKQFRVSLQD